MDRVCYACGARRPSGARCDCGEPLWLDVDRCECAWTDLADAPGMWRYAPLLPFDSPGGFGDAVGGTPLARTPALDEYAGARVSVKVEGANPTGSFKDRGSALGVAAASARGAAAVGAVSHGNMAMSTAAAAASAGLACVVLVPADIPSERLALIARYDPTLLRVAGDYGRLYDRSLDLGAERGIPFLNSDVPLRVEGQKTTAVEIAEAFAPAIPDAVVLPVSSGGHLSGVWKAFRELRAAGAVESCPRIYGVQAAACAPIAAAFDAGADRVAPVDAGETVAYSIANASPPSGDRVLVAVRETGGAVVAVDDGEIREARTALAREAGLSVESASATSLAGARALADAGDLRADDDVVLVATGTGFKERSAGAAPPAETVAIEDLDERLDGVAE